MPTVTNKTSKSALSNKFRFLLPVARWDGGYVTNLTGKVTETKQAWSSDWNHTSRWQVILPFTKTFSNPCGYTGEFQNLSKILKHSHLLKNLRTDQYIFKNVSEMYHVLKQKKQS